MTLSAALNAAKSSLAATAAQTALLSRNVAGAGDPNYSRKIATLARPGYPGVQLVSAGRVENNTLFEKLLGATSAAAAQKALSTGLDRIAPGSDDTTLGGAVATKIAKLTDALQTYATAPNDVAMARSAALSAGELASALNAATAGVQGVRAQADADIAASVQQIRKLLADFGEANAEVVGGTRTGRDVTDAQDRRDTILTQLADEIGITVVRRESNDIAIYSDSGATLFDKSARPLAFDASGTFTAGVTGNPVSIDGMAADGGPSGTSIRSGKLAGLLQLRDEVTVTYQSQLDEVARGLIGIFAESDQSATPSLPDRPGLFTWPGAPAMPGGGITTGLAGAIRLDPAVDAEQGGNPLLLRDGGIAGAAYTYNRTGAAAFSGRVQELIDKLGAARSFDPAAGAGTAATLTAFAGSSIGWLETTRKAAGEGSEYQGALLGRASEALSNATGVNLDNEMSLMLDLEHTYQASSKLIAAIDSLLDVLFEAVR